MPAQVPTTTNPVPPHLARAVNALKELGFPVREPDSAPISALIRKVAEVDETRAVVIARTIAQQEVFDMIVAEQIASMKVGERFAAITNGFDSIREDAKRMVDQLADGRISFGERIGNVVMKITRGDIATRFDAIRRIYLEVTDDVREQIEREEEILSAYAQFRGALKEAEVLAYEILARAATRLEAAKKDLYVASSALHKPDPDAPADRARLELARDEALVAFEAEDSRYQIVKDLAENLRISYNATEVTMARLAQAHAAKERIWKQAVTFFSTNTTVLSALKASFTGISGLYEATRTVDAMKDGLSKSLETLAEIGGEVQETAIRSGYGPTVRAESVKRLLDSVVSFQERSQEIINEMRELSTRNADEIRESVEAGKRRMAHLAARSERV